MRAARTLAVSRPLIAAINTGVGQYGAAQIIERETGVAELVEALEEVTRELWEWEEANGRRTSPVLTDAQALLAKHRTKEASQ